MGAAATAIFLAGALSGPLLGVVVEAAGFGTMFVVVAGCTLLGALVARGVVVAPSVLAERPVPEPAPA